MSNYIGKTISLISNKGLRYVGLLDNINAEDATVALKSVRMFGTEGRLAAQGNPNLEVPPGNDIYDYVVFRGSDVKDLSVLDIPVDQVKPEGPTAGYYAPPTMPQTAAPPVSAGPTGSIPQSAPATTTTAAAPAQPAAAPGPGAAVPSQTAAVPTETATEKSPVSGKPQPTKTEKPRDETPTKTTTEEVADAQPGSEPTAHHSPRHHHHHPQARRGSADSAKHKGPDIPTEEFDFEQANAKFSKELEQERELEHTGYNKSASFFDNISSSTEERNSMRWAEEKNLNLDTFGESSLHRRGRGGYRGGRGGYRGRGGRGGGYRGGNWRGGSGSRGGGSRNNTNDYHNKPEWA
ncbi:uncharacterized protein J8A68_001331 [[Candida] subhashii]|uniref:Protein SCD6 n=1 Tax=[Candida] subhashii TaxID=561895 RepID=A0A8J5R4H3_9ASCO|nr:uncharacterized protein J8A68_001331 [[Candida] subhashii]KAG7665275.1 hypothetical protein J8A68_001331 [[Candida] subhashii]